MHRSDIDGLRAIAVLAVLFFHYGFSFASGGYVGVDVFFVISGFLITERILEEETAGRFTILSFYERRARRIVPALLVVTAVCAAASFFVFLPNDLRKIGDSAITAVLFVSNAFFLRVADDYFDAGNIAFQPLLHTWSLAIEAQFYLVYPAVLVLTRNLRPSRRLTVLAGVGCASFLIAWWSVVHWPSGAFYLLQSRAWELMLGAVLALWTRVKPSPVPFPTIAGVAGMALIGVGVIFYDRETPFPGSAALLPCLGAGLMIFSGSCSPMAVPLTSRLLSLPPLVFIGRISYSLYLWHWPLLVFVRYRTGETPSGMALVALALATLGLATLSWYFVERPFIEKRLWRARRALTIGLSTSMAAVIALGVVTNFVGRGKLPALALSDEVLRLANGQYDRVSGDCIPQEVTPTSRLPCRFGSEQADQPRILLWGNSFARMWAPALDVLGKRHDAAGVAAVLSACPPLLGLELPYLPICRAFNDRTLAFVRSHPEIKTVVLSGNWIAWRKKLPALERTVAALHDLDRRVFVVMSPPQPGYHVPQRLALAALQGQQPPPSLTSMHNDEEQEAVAAVLRPWIERFGIVLIDPSIPLCEPGFCMVQKDAKPLYYDNEHLSRFGALTASGVFEPVFAR